MDNIHCPLWLVQHSTQLTYQIPKRAAANGATRITWSLVYFFSRKKKSRTSAIPGARCRARSILNGTTNKAGDEDEDDGSDANNSSARMKRGNRRIKVQ